MRKLFCKYKNKIAKFLQWSVVGLFFTIVVPLAINYAFTIPASFVLFEVDWEAKDALGFYGALLGATATILALHKTIKFTSESQREDRKLSIKPRLETKLKDCKNIIFSLTEQNFIFVDYNKGYVESSESLPSELSDILILIERVKQRSSGSSDFGKNLDNFVVTSFENIIENYKKKHFLLLYEIYNYGAANAIDVRFSINDLTVCVPFCISKDQPKRFVLIFNDDCLDTDKQSINISLVYTDICSIGVYEQKESFTIFKVDSEFNTVQAFEDQLSSPKEIECNNKKK